MLLLSLKVEEDPHNISSATPSPNVLQDISTEPSRFSAVSSFFTTPLSTEATSQMISEEQGNTDVLLQYLHLLVVQASLLLLLKLTFFFHTLTLFSKSPVCVH